LTHDVTHPHDDRRGAVISDLHLLSNRTTLHRHIKEVEAELSNVDLFVLNGDIFDFEWSRHNGPEASIAAAIEWIEEFTHRHPHCRFIVMQGNHDCTPAYGRALDELTLRLDNVEWHELHWRIGRRLFLHGDVYHGETPEQLKTFRALRHMQLQRHPVMHGIYFAALKAGLSRLILANVSRSKCAGSIERYIDNVFGPDQAGIDEVFFGHVHTPFTHFKHNEITYHNTGAAVIGTHLHMIRFSYNDDDSETSCRELDLMDHGVESV